MEQAHTPVLLKEVIDFLKVQKGHWYVDSTFGRAGHTRAILALGGKVIALDADAEAIKFGQKHLCLEIEQKKLYLIRENFEKIKEIIEKIPSEISENIDGVLADFGLSSPQIASAQRGFSFYSDGPLDMRMDDRLGVTAKDLINALGKRELYELFIRFGGEQRSRVIVAAILDARSRQTIETTGQLAHIIEKAVGRSGRLHPATKVFQALRIAVNDELGAIERFLPSALKILKSGGRLVTISFHEGEDRLVKEFMSTQTRTNQGKMMTDGVISPDETELDQNPRARSAKLRAFVKI